MTHYKTQKNMSALSYQSASSTSLFNVTVGRNSKVSQISANQQDLVKFFNQKTGDMMQGMCRLEQNFQTLYPLFRGLISLGKPSSLILTFSPEEKSIFYSFRAESLPEVEQFFTRILTLLQKEVKFKKVLKEIIENRLQFKAEQRLLHSALLVD